VVKAACCCEDIVPLLMLSLLLVVLPALDSFLANGSAFVDVVRGSHLREIVDRRRIEL
jgi:hypothetical protein